MGEVKHTPGPFEVQNPMGDDVGLWVVQAGLLAHEWSCIAIVPRDEDRSGKHFITKAEQKSNAALFAAAPDLLAAAKDIIASRSDTYKARNGRHMGIEDETGEKMWIVPFDEMLALEAAISKAEGKI